MSDYFSDRERGPRPRTLEEVPQAAWGGVVALIRSLIETGALGIDFPDMCPDGRGPVGTDQAALALAMQADIPEMPWPLVPADPPSTLAILDLLEFSHRHVSRPIEGSFHQYFQHSHLGFEREPGQQDFRERVNRILARNGLAYEINGDGKVVRLAPVVLGEALATTTFATGDAALDSLLESARTKFLSPDLATRRESLEKLWDAWERAKSLNHPADKKTSITALLDGGAREKELRDVLEKDALELTRIGNDFRIRHSEVGKVPVERSEHIDYLFHRLFALLFLLLGRR